MTSKITTFAMAAALTGGLCSICNADLVNGIIKEVDVDNGTISLHVGGKGAAIKIVKGKVIRGGEVTSEPRVFNLKAPTIPVLLADGKKARLIDLKPGVPVTLQLSVDEDVETIVAGAAVRSGVVEAIDFDKKQLVLEAGKKGGAGGTVQFAADAAVTVYGLKRTVAELRPGQHVLLLMSLDQSRAISIIASLKRTSDDPRGAATGADAAARTITLLVGRDGAFRFASWPVADDARFVFNELELTQAKLTDVPIATNLNDLLRVPAVWLRLDREGKSVAAIVADPASLPVVIESLDAGKRTLQARMPDGKLESFIIDADADIRRGSKRTELESLPTGIPATLTLGWERGHLIGIRAKKE